MTDALKFPKILIIDDDVFFLSFAKRLLGTLGISGDSAVGVETAAEAIALIRQDIERFDLLFLDIEMPDRNGIEVVHEMIEIDFPGHIAIVSGTSPNIIELATRLAEAWGVTVLDVVEKPLTPEKVDGIFSKWREATAQAT
jgi:CheY-like chemotaxis protein